MNRLRRLFIAAIVGLMLVPGYPVVAEKQLPSYKVVMQVIKPIDFDHDIEGDNGPEIRRPVNDVVLSSDEIISKKSDGPEYAAVINHRTKHINNVDASNGGSNGSIPIASVDTPQKLAENDKNSKFASQNKKYVPKGETVSIYPGENLGVRKESVSEDGGFFTTPKRMLGLSGNLVRMKPGISVVETYDSNVDYKDITDLVTTFKPSLTMDIINDDTRIHFRGDFIYRDYMEHSDLDRYDYNLSLSGKYKFSPVVDAGLTIENKRRHNLDQNTADVGAVHLDPSIIFTTVATPELNWKITPRDQMRFVYSIDKTDYERTTDSDYLSQSFSAVWAHALRDERTSFFLGQLNILTHYSREMDDLNGDQYTSQAIFGFEHAFTESLSFSLKGGPGVTFSNYKTQYDKDDGKDFMYQFRAELAYRRPRYDIVPSIERIVRPGRYGENEIMDRAEIYMRYKITEEFFESIIANYWLLEGEGVNEGEEHKSRGIFIQSVTNWDFDEDWRLFLGFNFGDNRNRITDKTTQRFKSWIGISYAFPTELR